MTLLALKLLLAPLLVVGSSLAARRWGHAVAGMLVAFPLVAGPILLIAALEHGQRFGARAAGASLVGIAALALFVVVFSRLAFARSWPLALLVGWVAYVTAALALSPLAAGLAPELAVAVCAILLAALLMPGERERGAAAARSHPRWDLPARALATALLVLSVTGAAAALGPTLTGVLAPFPVATSVLAAFVLAHEGPGQANAMLRGFLRGALGFAAFSFVAALLLAPAGPSVAFALALCGALLVQLLARMALAGQPAGA